MKRRTVGLVLAAFLVAGASLALWLSMRQPDSGQTITIHIDLPAFSLAELVERSELVVLGTTTRRIGSSRYIQPESNSTFVYTDWELVVERHVRSRSNVPISSLPSLVVRTTGGEAGDLRVISPDSPSFQPGEKVLLFLYKNKEFGQLEAHQYTVFAEGLGKFRVEGNLAYRDSDATPYYLNELLRRITTS